MGLVVNLHIISQFKALKLHGVAEIILCPDWTSSSAFPSREFCRNRKRRCKRAHNQRNKQKPVEA